MILNTCHNTDVVRKTGEQGRLGIVELVGSFPKIVLSRCMVFIVPLAWNRMQPFFNRNNRDSSPSSVRGQTRSVPFCPEFVAGRKCRSCVVTGLLGHGDGQ